MRNLIEFIWKNHFTLLFLFLEVIGFYLLLTQNVFHESKLHQTSVALSGAVYNTQHAYSQYLGLNDENEKLRQANATLLRQTINSNPGETHTSHASFTTIPVEAIQSTYHLENNYIIINAGRAMGVKPSSAVINNEGVVGIVHSVSEHYASVIPLLHSQSQISARLEGSEYFGQCGWSGIDPEIVVLENIPNHVKIDSGNKVITRGGGGIFPPGLVIGVATIGSTDESSGFQEIKVKLAADFRKLRSLYVIVNDTKPELDSLLTKTTEWTD